VIVEARRWAGIPPRSGGADPDRTSRGGSIGKKLVVLVSERCLCGAFETASIDALRNAAADVILPAWRDRNVSSASSTLGSGFPISLGMMFCNAAMA